MRGDLLDELRTKINRVYNGRVVCSEENADIRVWFEGEYVPVEEIDVDYITYESGEKAKLLDTDIATLAYLNECL